ncbi:hypothetical protein HIM_06050 [Hirsutella minnesotensis 3608]|uniref:Cytochrome P450 n=1 Tax=Hirsutella minnesotensis 3608 TaxID=1043627 RepID=A0A0F8A4Z8_9HYPO|nr:hypothetical protein HIM_06050 [Hirsutella minnesotensis 3608]
MSFHPRVTKGDAYRMSQLEAKFPSMINVLDGEQHRRKRRIVGQAITERSMRAFEPVMSAQVNVFLQQILKSCERDDYVDMTERCARLGVDIIALLAFGFPLKTQTESRYQFLPASMDQTSWRMNIYMQFPPIKPIERFLSWIGYADSARFKKTIGAMIYARKSQDKDAQHDLYSVIASYMSKENQEFLRGELWPEAILFILAGGATTASAMAATFFYLTRNLDSYSTLEKEIRSTFSSAEEITAGSKLASCKYLRACIDEALRISPPTSTLLWRGEEAGNDNRSDPFVIDGHVIPKGTQVAVSLYSLLHNEKYYPDPFSYKPERWLEPSGEEAGAETEEQRFSREIMRRAFAPFMLGDRGCAGKAMAYLELSLTLARTVWYFDFEAAPGKAGQVGGGIAGRTDGRGRPDEFQTYDMFIASHYGPNVVFRKRGEYWRSL